MRNSLSSETHFQAICKKFSKFLNQWWVKHIALPVFQMLPPAILLYVLRSDGKIPDMPSYYHHSVQIVFNHPFITITVIVGYIIFWKAIIGFFDRFSKNTDEIDVKSLLILFEVLENIVAAKAARFGDFVKGALNQETKVSRFFRTCNPIP